MSSIHTFTRYNLQTYSDESKSVANPDKHKQIALIVIVVKIFFKFDIFQFTIQWDWSRHVWSVNSATKWTKSVHWSIAGASQMRLRVCIGTWGWLRLMCSYRLYTYRLSRNEELVHHMHRPYLMACVYLLEIWRGGLIYEPPCTTVHYQTRLPVAYYSHGRSQDFLWGVHFSWPKIRWPFLVVTGYCIVIMHPNTAINCLFISSAGVHLTKFSSFLPRFNKKCLEKFSFRRPGGAPAPPGHAYAYNLRLLATFRSSGAQISSSVKIRLNGAETEAGPRCGSSLGGPLRFEN